MLERGEQEARVEPAESPLQPPAERVATGVRIVGRRRGDLIFIDTADIWAFEAAGRLTFVHCRSGRFDLDLSLTELEATLGPELLRSHRNWLVFSTHVREWRRAPERSVLIVGGLGGPGEMEVPVTAERLPAVRDALLSGAVGLRRRPPRGASALCANASPAE